MLLPKLFTSALLLPVLLALPSATAHSNNPVRGGNQFNVLFVILDDVGADQLRLTNPYGLLAPTSSGAQCQNLQLQRILRAASQPDLLSVPDRFWRFIDLH